MKTKMAKAKIIKQFELQELLNTGLSSHDAKSLHIELNDVVNSITSSSPVELWREITSRKLLKPSYPHSLHRLVYNTVYGDYDESVHGLPLYWFPSE